jgi:hypothetical protein
MPTDECPEFSGPAFDIIYTILILSDYTLSRRQYYAATAIGVEANDGFLLTR